MLSRKDVVVESVTGSGKTLAYLAPVFHFLLALETPLKPHQVRIMDKLHFITNEESNLTADLSG